MNTDLLKKCAFIIAGGACLFAGLPADIALLLGIALALSLGNPYIAQTRKATKHLLAISIIGLGAGMNLMTVAQIGLSGLGYTAISIGFALLAGRSLGILFRTDNNLSWLICVGTAICGGSAIAAIAPVIRAKDHHISVALGVVFILNAAALFLFPWIGHMIDMPQAQFGLWSALAIHDTSSVIGAGLAYGPDALEVGTTVKLVRAIWIIPLVFAVSFFYHRQADAHNDGTKTKPTYPWFILGFLIMAAIATWAPTTITPAMELIAWGAKRALVLTLFLIGTTLTLASLRLVGPAPFLQGVILWVVVAGVSLAAIMGGVITP